jgi:hypothetical protein
MKPKKSWSTPVSILGLFLMTSVFCISGISHPLPILPDFGGACGRELSCVAGSAVFWAGALIVIVAIERFFPD